MTRKVHVIAFEFSVWAQLVITLCYETNRLAFEGISSKSHLTMMLHLTCRLRTQLRQVLCKAVYYTKRPLTNLFSLAVPKAND